MLRWHSIKLTAGLLGCNSLHVLLELGIDQGLVSSDRIRCLGLELLNLLEDVLRGFAGPIRLYRKNTRISQVKVIDKCAQLEPLWEPQVS